MTLQEKKVVLAFYKEQKRYNEAFAEFIQLISNVDISEDGNREVETT